MNILQLIQTDLNAPKTLRNNFGNYNYRSCETILEALKPLLAKHGCSLIIKDEMVAVGNRIYVKATATITDKDNRIIGEPATAFAREPETKKGMDEAQITGATSSYARKYALNGLFAIDDNKDPETDEHNKTAKQAEVSNEPDFRTLINNAVNHPNITAEKKEHYVKLLKSGTMPTSEATLIKICKDNNIKC